MNELHGELNQLPRLPQPSARNVRGTIEYKAPKLEEGHRNMSEPSQDQRDCPRDPAQAADLQNHRLIHDACDPPQHVEVICYEAEATRCTYPIPHTGASKDYIQSLHSREFRISS